MPTARLDGHGRAANGNRELHGVSIAGAKAKLLQEVNEPVADCTIQVCQRHAISRAQNNQSPSALVIVLRHSKTTGSQSQCALASPPPPAAAAAAAAGGPFAGFFSFSSALLIPRFEQPPPRAPEPPPTTQKMSCCPVTALPAVQGDGGITGALTKFNNTTLYVARPASGTTAKVGLLSIPDIFGLDSGRTKEDAETLAKLGYAVAVVDVTHGDYLIPGEMSGFKDWLAKNTFENVFGAAVQDAIAFLQSEFQVESIVSYGYCFGGWVGAHQSALPTPIIKGNISFHPSWRIENMTKGDGAVEKLAERVLVPQLLLAASDDPAFVRENGSVIKILSDKAETSAHSSAIDFPDVNHGWVNRGDLEKPEVKAAVAKAWHTALKFIQTVAPQ